MTPRIRTIPRACVRETGDRPTATHAAPAGCGPLWPVVDTFDRPDLHPQPYRTPPAFRALPPLAGLFADVGRPGPPDPAALEAWFAAVRRRSPTVADLLRGLVTVGAGLVVGVVGAGVAVSNAALPSRAVPSPGDLGDASLTPRGGG